METRLSKHLDHCSICYEKAYKQGKINSCSHIFCYQCISNWSKIQNTCPMCKRRFTNISEKTEKKWYNFSRKNKKKQVNIKAKNQNQAGQTISFNLDEFTEGLLQIIHFDFQLFSTVISLEELDSPTLHFQSL